MSFTFDGIEISSGNKLTIIKEVIKYPILGQKFDEDNSSKKEIAIKKVINTLKKKNISLTKTLLSKFLYRLRYKIKFNYASPLVDYECIYKEFLNNSKTDRPKRGSTDSGLVTNKIQKRKEESCGSPHLNSPMTSHNSFAKTKSSTPFVVISNYPTKKSTDKQLENRKKPPSKQQTSISQWLTSPSKNVNRKNQSTMVKKNTKTQSTANPKNISINDVDDGDLQGLTLGELERLLFIETITLSSLKKQIYEKKLNNVQKAILPLQKC